MPGIESHFKQFLHRYAADPKTIKDLWNEILENHSTKLRHYHDLRHLEHILIQLTRPGTAEDMDALVLATAYHDVIQNIVRKDDEERSAELMRERLGPFKLPENIIDRAANHILATKEHERSTDPDTNLFIDADLSILGSPDQEYQRYSADIRKEYMLVPDLIYNAGRKKVLMKILSQPKIFKTGHFEHLEAQARRNMSLEIASL